MTIDQFQKRRQDLKILRLIPIFKMAHRCWAVNDIVSLIIENLVRDNGRASAVALANCSKSLEEPALREVWRMLDSLVPLVKCFPPEVWEIRGKERKLASTGLEDL